MRDNDNPLTPGQKLYKAIFNHELPYQGDISLEDLQLMFKFIGPAEKDVIEKRFGFDGSNPQTLEQVAKGLGVTRESVRIVEGKALRKMRQALIS